MQQPDQHTGQGCGECLMRLCGVGQVYKFAFFNQRADPVHLSAFGNLAANTFNHITAPRVIHDLGHDGCAAGWQLVDG